MLALGVSNPSSPQMPKLNSAMPSFSPILTIAVQSGVPPFWTDSFKLQKRTAWMRFDLPTQTLTALLLAKLKWMSLIDSVLYRKAVVVYKSLNGFAPGYMRYMFKYVTDVFLVFFFNKNGFAFFIRVFCWCIGFNLMLQWPFLFNISIKHAMALF